MNIKKGDKVTIMTGKDRGKSGTVLRVFPTDDKVIVEALNLFKKRSKPKKQGQKGEMVEVPRPLRASNVMILCGNCKKPTRVGFRIEGANKSRYCKKCSATL